MISHNEYLPDDVSPPGDSLADALEERGMTQADLARGVGHAEKTIRAIIDGKAPITSEMSAKLEKVLGIPARFWETRQAQYDEHVARKQQLEKHR